MKALILAAGAGLRLRPLTDATPKALLPVGGVPMLERVAARLQAAGVHEFAVNAHHHADQIADFCAGLARRLGARILVSREDGLLLDTGGGLKQAARLLDGGRAFLGGGPFFLHNADVLSDLDLDALALAHARSGALATLACRKRDSGRSLMFSPSGLFLGRQDEIGRAHV